MEGEKERRRGGEEERRRGGEEGRRGGGEEGRRGGGEEGRRDTFCWAANLFIISFCLIFCASLASAVISVSGAGEEVCERYAWQLGSLLYNSRIALIESCIYKKEE